jgi:hypothetical protein
MLWVDQADLEAASLQKLIDRNPVDAGSLHRDGANSALLKPICQYVKITGKRGKSTYGRQITIGADCDEQLARASIDPSSIGMQNRQLITSSMTLLRHGDLHAGRVPRARMQSKLPIEIAARRRSSSHICIGSSGLV